MLKLIVKCKPTGIKDQDCPTIVCLTIRTGAEYQTFPPQDNLLLLMISYCLQFTVIMTRYSYILLSALFEVVHIVPEFLDAFAKLRKAYISFIMSVRPSVHMEQLGTHQTDFHEIWYLRILRKSVRKSLVSLQSDKNNGYFTWRPIYFFGHISLSSSWNEKYFRQKL
jgi:hypothetical protein